MTALVRLATIGALTGVCAVSAAQTPASFPARASMRDGALAPRHPAAAAASWHGGALRAATGEQVTVFVSDSYSDDTNPPQRWADFFAGLIHGSELAALTAYIATPAEIASMCGGEDVLGCYGRNMLVAPGEIVEGTSPDEVARHEYGHHVAANRVNAPWRALDWGTKRWATREGVCARTGAGTAYPGDEGRHYKLNPGEAFAETYRVLNDVRAFGAPVDWQLLDPTFLPDGAALDAVEQDVRAPWTGPTTSVLRGRFAAGGARVWTTTVATPLDGALAIALSFPRGARDAFELRGANGVVAKGLASGATSQKLDFLVCGQRSLAVRVARAGTPGAFSLTIQRP